MAKTKKTKKVRPEERRGVDGRRIGERRDASSHRGKRNMKWTIKDMEKAIQMWKDNEGKPEELQLSKREISIITGIPRNTLAERLSGRVKGTGYVAGGRRTPRILTQGQFTVQAGHQVGQCTGTCRYIVPLVLTYSFPLLYRTRTRIS